MDYFLSKPDTDLRLRRITPIRNIGIENLSIRRSPNQSASLYRYNIYFNYAVNCWVRGVKSYKPSRSHLAAEHSSHLEISGCYFHEATKYDGNGYGYGVSITFSTTNTLVENNIFRKLRHALVAAAGSNCNVWGYNYSLQQYSIHEGIVYEGRDLDFHGKYPFGHLFEQNVIEKIGSDDEHGWNGDFNLFFRNHVYRESLTGTNVELLKMKHWSTLGNIKFINPLYAPSHRFEYAPYKNIFGFENNYTLPKTHDQVWVYPYSGENCELKDISYYHSDRPYFLPASTYSWPAIGPRVNTGLITQSIPAKARYNAGEYTYNTIPTPKPPRFTGTLFYDQDWAGNITLGGDVVILEGVTLTIQPGTNITIPDGGKITVEGTLDARGTSSNNITFAAANSSWYGIVFTDTADDNGCILEYCDISDVTYGVYTNSASPAIKNCNITDALTGIYAYNSNAFIYDNEFHRCENYSLSLIYSGSDVSENYINGQNITNPSARGIYISQNFNGLSPGLNDNFLYRVPGTAIKLRICSPDLYQNVLQECGNYGIYCQSYANPDMQNDNSNFIISSGSHGLYISSTSLPLLYNGHNSFHGTTGHHIYSLQSAQINARCNWFNSNPPSASKIYGNIQYDPWCLDYNCNSCGSGMAKSLVSESDPVSPEQGHFYAGLSFETNKQYADALLEYQYILENFPETEYALLALVRMPKCYKKAEKLGETIGLLDKTAIKHSEKVLGGMALLLAANQKVNSGFYDSAEKDLSKIIKKKYDDDLLREAYFQMFQLYVNIKKDEKSARKVLTDFEKIFPNDEHVVFMKSLLGDLDKMQAIELLKKMAEDEPQDRTPSENIPQAFALYENYPNPFNPMTHINYDVPKANNVKLTIYNILGQKVRTLNDTLIPAGTHTAVWDGCNDIGNRVSAGIYICVMQAGEYVHSIKMTYLP